MASQRTVLFVCIHNSARSQMAQAFLRQMGGGSFKVESAGLEPGKINPLVVEAMQRIGIDLSSASTQSVFDLYRAGRLFEYVISVCDGAAAQKCPVFPGIAKRLNWEFEDPSSFQGTHHERLEQTIRVRDQIRARIAEFIATEGAVAASEQ